VFKRAPKPPPGATPLHYAPEDAAPRFIAGLGLGALAVVVYLAASWPVGAGPWWAPIGVLVLLPVSIPVHEQLHVLAHMIFGRLHRRELDVRLAVVAAQAPEYLAAYRVVLLTPGCALLLAFFAVAVVVDSYFVAFLLFAALAGADRDIRAWWGLRGLPGCRVVLDLPVGRSGCLVWPPPKTPTAAAATTAGTK
jgi:hypothetical protein